MQAVVVPLPPYHPRVLQAAHWSLFTALIPRYSAAIREDNSIPESLGPVDHAAETALRRIMKLLVRHHGCVPVNEAVRFLLKGDSPGELTETRREIGLRLLRALIMSSELIQVGNSGTTFSLHPAWAQRFCDRYEERERCYRAGEARWGYPELPYVPAMQH